MLQVENLKIQRKRNYNGSALKSAQCLNRNRLEKTDTIACRHKLTCMHLESFLKSSCRRQGLTLLMGETMLGNAL